VIDTSKPQQLRSNCIYDEFCGKMDLNCIYSDLLDNYLNFFLPINTRDVNFPQLINYSQQQQPITSPNQAPRLLKQSFFDKTELLIKHEDSTLEQINSSLFHKKLDRTNDLQKIDFFLKLLIDLWISPFSDNSNDKYLNGQLLAQHDVIFVIKSILKHIYSFSNANYSNSLRNTSAINIEDSSYSYDKSRRYVNDGSYLNHRQLERTGGGLSKTSKTPIDDLRM
jgi:hypothetical protein